MAVNLKECPGTDLVGGLACCVSKVSGSERHRVFRLSALFCRGRRFQQHGADCLWQVGGHGGGPFFRHSARDAGVTRSLDQQLSVLGIRKKFHFVNSSRDSASATHFPERRNGAIDQWRTYRTFLNRKQFV